jgi:hypothetical protein
MGGPRFGAGMRVLPVLVFLVLTLAPMASAAATMSQAFGAAGTPRFDMYPAPSTLMRASSGEPTIGIPWNTNHAFYQAGSRTFKIVFDDSTFPATATWTDVSPAFTAVNVDPMMHADHVTNRVWAGGLDGACSVMGMSDDDGATWVPAGNMCNFAQFDHQSIGSGPWANNQVPRNALYQRATYYCSQLQGNTPQGQTPGTACTTSLNGGLTWTPPVEVLGGCGGLHGHIRVSEVTGIAAVPDASCNAGEGSLPGGVITQGTRRIGFGYTTDNGASWNSRVVPGSVSGRGFDPSVDFSHKSGWLYIAQADSNGIHVAMSKDEGRGFETIGGNTPGVDPATWLNLSSLYRDPRTNAPIKYAAFTDVLAGDDDRAAVAFLGTTAGEQPFTDSTCGAPSDPAIWHYYIAQTFDAAQTWTVTRLSDDPVQIGAIWAGGGSQACRNLLDFAGIDMDKQGRIHIAFADGCRNACVQKYENWTAGKGDAPKGSDSRTRYSTVFRQSTGLGLFAKEDGQHPNKAGPGPGTNTTTTSGKGTPAVGIVALVSGIVGMAILTRWRKKDR